MAEPKCAVIIPVFNHGRTLAGVVLQTLTLGFPVFVVDDGSSDGGPESVRTMDGVRLLEHHTNRGKGAALLTGFRAAAAAGARWAITLDADGQHHPEDARHLIKALPTDRPAIIVGSRQGMLGAGAPWTSRFGRGFSNFWIRSAGGPRIDDSQSGFRLYPLPETLELNVQARRYQFELEILIKAHWQGLAVCEAPIRVTYQPPGERISHFHPFFDFLRNSGMFTRMIFHHIMNRKRI